MTQDHSPNDIPPQDNSQRFYEVPFMGLLGIDRAFSKGGKAQLVVAARRDLENPMRAMHGGVVATLLDVVMASAAVSRIDFSRTAVTLNMNISYLRPGHGRLVADGEVVMDGDEVVHCKACVTDEDGHIVARSQGSFRYLPIPERLHNSTPATATEGLA